MVAIPDTEASLEEIDRNTALHPSTDHRAHANGTLARPRIIDHGKGIRITDSKGNELIDALAGLYCVNASYGGTGIADAIHAQARKLAYYHHVLGQPGKCKIISRQPA